MKNIKIILVSMLILSGSVCASDRDQKALGLGKHTEAPAQQAETRSKRAVAAALRSAGKAFTAPSYPLNEIDFAIKMRKDLLLLQGR